jgi:tetratricopeptide (TPR) repeat protein
LARSTSLTATDQLLLVARTLGRTTEALAENKVAQELDPFRITFKGNEGGILNAARRYDEALQVSQNVIRMQPEYPFGHLNLANAYLGKGMSKKPSKSIRLQTVS